MKDRHIRTLDLNTEIHPGEPTMTVKVLLTGEVIGPISETPQFKEGERYTITFDRPNRYLVIGKKRPRFVQSVTGTFHLDHQYHRFDCVLSDAVVTFSWENGKNQHSEHRELFPLNVRDAHISISSLETTQYRL
ncbi:hypothetical protein C5B42_04595 [Candidatus Cerribacteria bacterium 'Amazon FNV 2010 28 9']|uniref:Uncharacterized protein n=1 Tax=Candidatus Cerribacteria bacterium 'Amazon FNV 2010 28 9' TaxID=2081795 RepID=A0A317JSU8_9BACT|nr:MAG: hypothetical protein C5B42_04595 [Candidatus Cerribacteria bacterium 'Amazon FNV 2010 28 9']